jgi:hypothetical protein
MAYYTSNYHYTYTTSLDVTFLQPTFEIGAFFGNDDPEFDFTTITLSVFDKNGNLLGSYPRTANENTSVDQFLGIRSDVPFYSARFENNGETRCIVLDDMSFSVPEPCTLLLLGLGAAIVRKRHR